MGLKRPGEPESELSAAKREKIDNLISNADLKANQRTAAGSREMQGQSSTGGMHSIDSDEEEEYEKSKKVDTMNDDDFEGVEDDTIARDGEIKITPFNLKEEQEDGEFAKDGNFIWKKKNEEITDSWLDNVDWEEVKETSAEDIKKREAEEKAEDEAEAKYNEISCYRKIVALLNPKESVAKALRRYGGGKKTSAQRLKEKKRQKEGKETEEEKNNRENMETMTAMADAILSRSGNMEIYEETFEGITHKLKLHDEANKTEIPEDADDDDALDMFLESAKTKEGESKLEEESSDAGKTDTNKLPTDDEIKWEFKWENSEEAEIHGPHSTQEMQNWSDSGYFDKPFFVRKFGQKGDFGDGKRIDFELYL